MRAIVLTRFGEPDVLREELVPRPSVGLEGLLIRVRACGVCGHDVLARKGALGGQVPRILGHEIAGDVAEASGAVGGFSVGDRVVLNQRLSCGTCAACRGQRPNLCMRGRGFYGDQISGGYAEYVVATPGSAVRLPPRITYEAAAAIPCGANTGFHAIRRLGLGQNDSLLVTGRAEAWASTRGRPRELDPQQSCATPTPKQMLVLPAPMTSSSPRTRSFTTASGKRSPAASTA